MDSFGSTTGWSSCRCSSGRCWWSSGPVPACSSGVSMGTERGKHSSRNSKAYRSLRLSRILRRPDNDCRALIIYFLLHILILTFEILVCDKLQNQTDMRWIVCFIPLFICTLFAFFSCLWSLKVQRNFLVRIRYQKQTSLRFARLDSSLHLSEWILFPFLFTASWPFDFLAIRGKSLLLLLLLLHGTVSSRWSSFPYGSLYALLCSSSSRNSFWQLFIDVRVVCWLINVNWARLPKQCSTPRCSFHSPFSR